MREYRYCAILHTEDGSNFDMPYWVYGKNKADVIAKIEAEPMFDGFPITIKEVTRVNITDKKRNRAMQPDLAFVDMGQCF